MIYNPPTSPFADYYLRPFEAAGLAYGVQPSAAAVHSDADIENAIKALAREPGGGFVVLPDTFAGMHRDHIVSLAARYRLPAVYPFRWFAEIGGLLSYGIDSDDMFRGAASMSIAFSKVRSRLTFRCRRQPNTNWSSISRPPRHWGSRSPSPSCCAPTR